MIGNTATSASPLLPNSSEPYSCLENGNNNINNKRKRRPAGTPDPDAEVVSLSPKTLLESDRYVCEICNQGFQRDQNLQMHRRRHKVPWKLLKRESPVVRKRVFVCPEPTCLHHDPCHALGDLVGIKKHFRRKHSNHKQWVCEKCSKGYAVQSDYKAHLKTCGTRGHSCDCGRVFSRVESFIEHQDACNMGHLRQEPQVQPACLSRTASSPSPSSDTNFSSTPAPSNNWPALVTAPPTLKPVDAIFLTPTGDSNNNNNNDHNLDLKLSTASNGVKGRNNNNSNKGSSTKLELSMGSFDFEDEKKKMLKLDDGGAGDVREEAREELRVAMAEKAYAEEARKQAKRQIEMAEEEFGNAKRMRQQAQAELDKATALKQAAIKQINSTILEITCQACQKQFQAKAKTKTKTTTTTTTTTTSAATDHDNYSSVAFSYVSSVITTEGEVEKDQSTIIPKPPNN
ncbi:protein SHOOT GRAVITROPISM 5-like [Cucumis melo var. makuwa]|uniref:Protein SHOOT GRAVITROPISM 5-like n=2 Tax=Cucumis melo TaxID=3656 RepID=A0A1S3BW52_CUCME|nr:zinc finger protein SHOOT GRAVITROPISM 5-like [Cucumis melo]KAA0036036.1 protein SHOOT GRAVITROPISM 5-like [Cucumis melo var. makuwa]TYJ98839.1 protein SHOOT GRAVITROPISM 5-like [Cucumis melo var. makuwa]